MAAEFDLDAYFARIGYSGDATPTLRTLQAVHLAHAQSVAFENLNSFLGWSVPLDPESLQRKILREGRGGYCFEQNALAAEALRAMGFQVAGLAARVVYNLPETVTLPRTHMLLRIELAGKSYLADVGFGGLTLTGPLRLELDVEQSTPHEPFRLVRLQELPQAPALFAMQAKIGGVWKPLYHFTLEEQKPIDYEMMNWFVSTHPKSRFVTSLIAARPDQGRRYALLNSELAIHFLDGRAERRSLATASDLRSVLRESFALNLPDSPELDAALARLVEQEGRLRAGASVARG